AAISAAAPEGLTAQAVRYSIRPYDAALLGGVGLIGLVPALAGTSLPYARCNPCDSARLWGIDRSTLGLPKEHASSIRTRTLRLTVLGGAALVALSRRGQPEAGKAAVEDLVVMGEALEIDGAVTQWAKVLFHRARPVLYTSAAGANQTVDAGRSFPSGHASFA